MKAKRPKKFPKGGRIKDRPSVATGVRGGHRNLLREALEEEDFKVQQDNDEQGIGGLPQGNE